MPPVRSSVDAALADLARVLAALGVEWFLFGAPRARAVPKKLAKKRRT